MELFILGSAAVAWAVVTRYAIVEYLKWKHGEK